MKRRIKIRFGFTMIELMVTMLIALLVLAGIGVAMVDSIKGFGKMYERTEGNYQRADVGVIPDTYVAKATFDSVCRKAYMYKADIDTTNHAWVTVYYYSSLIPKLPDLCAKFAVANNQLTVSYGDGTGGNFGTPVLLAKYVTAAWFDIPKNSAGVTMPGVTMAITIDNANDTNAKQKMKMTVTCAAVRHNE